MYLPMISLLTLYCGFAMLADKRLNTYLHIFQQEEYDGARFLPWLLRTRSLDTKATLALFAAALAAFFAPGILAMLGASITLALLGFTEKDPRKTGKKPLVLTARATRIRHLAILQIIALSAAVLAAMYYQLVTVWQGLLLFIVLVQVLPLLLVTANLLLKPVEKHQYKTFWNAARTRFDAIDPTTIGVTGSYGKTSVKQLLAHVLATAAPTYATKGSINTPMGVSRAIREEMPENTQYYVAEMGAYGIGSIGRMCALTPPHYGIVTALGDAHYERFKSLENVARAKFELAEWVFKQRDGITSRIPPRMVVSEQVLSQPYAAEFIKRYHADFIMVGFGQECQVRITDILQSATGTTVHLIWQNKPVTLTAPVWGGHHGHNMALVFAMSMLLGLVPQQVAMALKSAPQIKHRLEVKPQPNGITYIDDAYNSNPTGFEGALQTLTLLKTTPTGRRILVTPGMVELGERHDAEHARLGVLASQNADMVLVVNPARIPTFTDAVKPLGDNLHLVPNFTTAREWLNANARPGDVILLENDLPDLLEKRLSL